MSAEGFVLEVTQLSTQDGFRAITVLRPRGSVRGGILHLHPFAEEMNRSRGQVSRAAREMAQRGWLVLRIDFAGCGDSSDPPTETRWVDWIDDVDLAVSWLRRRKLESLVAWPLRAGSLVLSAWLRRSGEAPRILAWQPEYSGRNCLSHFLRLHRAGQLLRRGSQEPGSDPRARLASGKSVEVAGYPLDPSLAQALSGSTFEIPTGYPSRVHVLEIGGAGRETPTPASERWLREARDRGVAASVEVLSGDRFWLTEGGRASPELLRATLDALEGGP